MLFRSWLCWVFVSVRGLSLVVASGSHSSSRCAGLSLSRPLLLRSRGSRRSGSVVVAHGTSCSAACGIFPDQGSNPCPLHCRRILNHCATREALEVVLDEPNGIKIFYPLVGFFPVFLFWITTRFTTTLFNINYV